MNYKVSFEIRMTEEIQVEAMSFEDAEEKANDILDNRYFDYDMLDVDTQLVEKTWIVKW